MTLVSFQSGEDGGNDSDLVFDFEMEMGEDETITREDEVIAREEELEDGELAEDEASALITKYEKVFDPDIDLSHLDDKVQLLLGRFQRDFEDGFLRDSLEARYGGYGSFLPTQGYEESPMDPRNTNIKSNQGAALRSDARPGEYHARTPALPIQRTPLLNINRSSTIDNEALPSPTPAYQGASVSSAEPADIHRSDNAIEQTMPEVQTQLSPTSVLPEKNGAVDDVIARNSATIMVEATHDQSRMLSPKIQVVPERSRTGILENVSSSTAPGEYSASHSSQSLCSSGTPLGSDHTSELLEFLSSPGESFVSPLPESLLCIEEKDDGNSQPMASHDVCEVENQISEDSLVNRTCGDRRTSSPGDDQFDYNEHWTMKPHQRPGVNESKIHEEETPNTLQESHQHPTPARQNYLDGHPNDLASGPTTEDQNVVMSLNERNENDSMQIEANSKRLADEECLRVSKKSKLESLFCGNEGYTAVNHGVREETTENGLSVEKEARLHIYATREGNGSTASQSENGIQDEGEGTENIVSQLTDEIQDGRQGNENTASQTTNVFQGEGEGTENIVSQSTGEIQDGRNRNGNTASQSATKIQGEGNENIVSQSTNEIQDGREANDNSVSRSTDEIQEQITQTILQPRPNSPELGQASDEQHLAQLHSPRDLVMSPVERQEDGSMQIESNRKRLADQDSFRITKKSKLESLHHGNTDCSADNHGVREETNENGLSLIKEVRLHESTTREVNESTESQSTNGIQDEGEGTENIISGSRDEIQDERGGNENTASQLTNRMQDEAEGNENIFTCSTDEIQDGSENNENTASQSTNGMQDEAEGNENIVTQSTDKIQDGSEDNENTASQSTNGMQDEGEGHENTASQLENGIQNEGYGIDNIVSQSTDGREGNENTASQSTNGIQEEGEGNENIVSRSTDEIQEETMQISLQPRVSGDRSKVSKEPRSSSLRMDVEGSCSLEKDPSYQCSVEEVIKEGNDLKDRADYHKNFGSTLESTLLYFKAALKFLWGAFLLEPYSKEIAKLREITDSIFMYKEAANLCEFAASEYERCDKMAGAALAYKCMEVAHMRVVNSKATRANRERHELRISLQNLYRGDSPSSSGSDLDNVYNEKTLDKDVSSKMDGYRANFSGNRLKIERMLNFTKDVSKAMDASTKCQMALAAAKKCSDDPKYESDFSLLKRAINSSFHEVDSIIYLVQRAMEAFSA